MLEINLKNHLQTMLGMDVYPIKAPQTAKCPFVVYKEIGNARDSQSELDKITIRNKRYSFTIVSPSDEEVIVAKEVMINHYDGFSGDIGTSRILVARVVGSIPMFDQQQQNFEYVVDITFAHHIK